jgi:Tol biopolymer transport system component
VLIEDARQPGASADGTTVAYLRASGQGSALLVRAVEGGDEHELIAAGTFIDLATPRISPAGDQIAFAVATPFVGHRPSLFDAVFGVAVAYAHGLPWDVWLMGADGSNPHLLATLGADDPSLTWSPDGRQIFAYGGTGAFIVDAATGDLARYPYLAGYGATAWTR